MTDWKRILTFYEVMSQRDDKVLSEFGEKMYTLVSEIRDTTEFHHLVAGTAMYSFYLCDEIEDPRCLHISWENQQYRLSLNNFNDIDYEASENEVVSIIANLMNLTL